MRKPHYIKIASALKLPTQIVCVDTETHPDNRSTPDVQYHTLTLGCAIAYRLERGRRTRLHEVTFTTTADWWTWLVSRLSTERVTHIFAHNAPYDMGILDAWREWSSNLSWKFNKVIVDRGIFLVEGEYDGKRFIFNDTLNYFKCSLAALGKSIGRVKLDMPDTSTDTAELRHYCMNDTLIVADTVDNLVRFVGDNDYGPWGITAPSLAYNTWRKCYMTHKVLVHDYADVLYDERNAYHGGMVCTPFIGETKCGPIYECDVVSMYPSCCMGQLPSRYIATLDDPDIKDVVDASGDHALVAKVHLTTDKPWYPTVVNGAVVYPVGSFNATLCGDELHCGIVNGHVNCVYRCHLYSCAPIFDEYMRTFVARKLDAKQGGDAANESLYKLLLNSLYGKTVQRSARWVEVNDVSIAELSHDLQIPEYVLDRHITRKSDHPTYFWEVVIAEYGVIISMRSLFGVVEMCVVSGESRDSCPVIGAVITSRARTKLRGYHNAAGEMNWYYSDTDSIWVNERGLSNLIANHCIGDGIGELQIKGKCRLMQIHGRKDYVAVDYESYSDGRYVPYGTIAKTKGVRKNAEIVGDNIVAQERWPGVLSQLIDSTPGAVIVRKHHKVLHRTITHCLTSDNGWTKPLALNERVSDE